MTTSAPYRQEDKPKVLPGKIIQLHSHNNHLYALDDNGNMWARYAVGHNDKFVYIWQLCPFDLEESK